MSRMYSVQFNAVAITLTQDVFEIIAAAGKNCEICGVILGQTTDVGDAEAENLLVQFKSGHTATGSGGTAGTEVPLNVTDAAAGFLSEVNNTTKATGTPVIHHSDVWNIQQTFIWIPPIDMRIPLTGGRIFTVEMSAPADSITASGTIYVLEHG